nr:DUF1127 domain-containing protein [Oceanicola granulosus]
MTASPAVRSARAPRLGLADYLALYRQRRALARLDARALADIGVSDLEARSEAQRPLWDVPTHWLR